MEHLRFRLDRYTDRIVRVRVTPTDFATESNSEMVVLRPQAAGQDAVLEVDQDAERRIVFSSEGRTLLSISNFSFEAVEVIQTEMDPKSLVLKATVDGERVQAKIAKQTVIRRDWKARVYFEWDETEALYGLGMHEEEALTGARLIGTKDARGWTMVRGWLAELVCNYSGPVDVLTATKPGETLSLPFVGTMLAMHAIAGMDAGVLEVSIDGGEFTEMDLFDNNCLRFHRPVFRMLAHGLANGPHTARLRVADRQNPRSTGRAVRVLPFGASSYHA